MQTQKKPLENLEKDSSHKIQQLKTIGQRQFKYTDDERLNSVAIQNESAFNQSNDPANSSLSKKNDLKDNQIQDVSQLQNENCLVDTQKNQVAIQDNSNTPKNQVHINSSYQIDSNHLKTCQDQLLSQKNLKQTQIQSKVLNLSNQLGHNIATELQQASNHLQNDQMKQIQSHKVSIECNEKQEQNDSVGNQPDLQPSRTGLNKFGHQQNQYDQMSTNQTQNRNRVNMNNNGEQCQNMEHISQSDQT